MKVLLTGATGYIGSAVLTALRDAGHSVVAPVRRPEAVGQVEQAGASAVLGDVTDAGWFGEQLATADAAIHAASPSDATSADFDAAVATAVIDAFGGTAKPYLHTSGVWLWGSGDSLVETSPYAPPAMTSWRVGIERRLLESSVAVTVPAPGIVYGRGAGLTQLLLGGRDEEGRVLLVGDGSQHWTTVHVDDVAALYVVLLGLDAPAGHVLAVSGDSPTVRQIAESAGVGVRPESNDATAERLGAPLTEALLLDQQADGAKARGLGWAPTRAGVLEPTGRG
ncbi:NAD-dependent epimerase/dehydratase family protein [Nocardioides sp. URHA0020]|uniref:NAD-dependent epimerase/dehydratase family protein n=1 Tax=Nocardioides sp. URHA0020 TaxID=1380392 RepID=UPI00048EC571|nr:NAD-dependent epimerase/dehydratase family protein [Nocardioides sp. URHA0020]